MTSGIIRTLITKGSWRMSHSYLGIHSLMRCYWTPAWLLAKILMRGSCDIEELRKANLQSSMEISISIGAVSGSLLLMCVKNWGLGMLREGWDPTFPPHSVHAYMYAVGPVSRHTCSAAASTAADPIVLHQLRRQNVQGPWVSH
jgi:hypothetical protein